MCYGIFPTELLFIEECNIKHYQETVWHCVARPCLRRLYYTSLMRNAAMRGDQTMWQATYRDARTHMRPRDVADATGLRVETIYRFIREGRLRARRVGRGYFVPIEEFRRVFGACGHAQQM